MPFEILLQKPSSRNLEDNRVWVDSLCERFSGFREEQVDHAELAEDLAADIGLTPQEYLARGIGLRVECNADASMRVDFWDDTASIELPNFPPTGTAEAISGALPVLTFLMSVGFSLLDPASGEPTGEEPGAVLARAYAARQAQVLAVAKITGGRPV